MSRARPHVWAAALGVLLAMALLPPGTARAQTSIWTSASAPARHQRAQVYERADKALSDYFFERRQPAAFRRAQALNKARRVLERAGAERSPDPRLRYQLASAYYGLFDAEREPERLAQAAKHFDYVVNHPATTRSLRAEALSDLAIVYAHLGRHPAETRTYTRALELEPHAETRAMLLANRAEGFMVQGNIMRAVRGYRQSLATTPSPSAFRLSVTTLWGLAVALDRSGNLDGALQRITEARAYDPADARLNGPGWFYVPSYDDRWYKALGHWQRARQRSEPIERAAALRAAITRWRQYIELAPESDHWRALASRRLHQCEHELARTLHRKPKRKPRRK